MHHSFTSERVHWLEALANRFFDALVVRSRQPLGGLVSPYLFWLLIGFTLGLMVSLTLAVYLELTLWVFSLLSAAGMVSSLLLVQVTRMITGYERLTNYHHQITITITAVLVLHLVRLPVLVYLDVFALGLGVMAGVSRTSCLLAGCCHGRPHRWGVCYHTGQHTGIRRGYAGVRLFPVQMLESLWVLLVVIGGVTLLLTSPAPGSVLVWYVLLYAAGRFGMEFLRGDPDRPYYNGLSEPQWTSLMLLALLTLLGAANIVPLHAGILLALLITVAAWAAARRRMPLDPVDLSDLMEVLSLVTASAREHLPAAEPQAEVPLLETYHGLRISAGLIPAEAGHVWQYAFSRRDGPLQQRDIHRIATLIRYVVPGEQTLIAGSQGVCHLLVQGE